MTKQAGYIITLTVRCAIILLFSYTAVSKWLNYGDFIYQLQRSPFIPAGYPFLSVALPVAELGISLLLAVNTTAKAGLLASAILLFVFTVYIVAMLLWAPHVPCSCGGFISSLTWKQHIALNSFLLAASIGAYILHPGKPSPS